MIYICVICVNIRRMILTIQSCSIIDWRRFTYYFCCFQHLLIISYFTMLVIKYMNFFMFEDYNLRKIAEIQTSPFCIMYINRKLCYFCVTASFWSDIHFHYNVLVHDYKKFYFINNVHNIV